MQSQTHVFLAVVFEGILEGLELYLTRETGLMNASISMQRGRYWQVGFCEDPVTDNAESRKTSWTIVAVRGVISPMLTPTILCVGVARDC